MYLLTLVLGIVLLPEASTLRCYDCPPPTGTCTKTATCPLEKNRCAALRLVSYLGASELQDVSEKSCVEPELCGQHSLNTGLSRDILNVECCRTDLCNTQPAPEVVPDGLNGRKCYFCDGKTCSNTVNCLGNEYYCMKTTVYTDGQQPVTMKGCASTGFCSTTPTTQMTRATIGEISCCQGDYCNSASSTSAGLMLLVAPLISLVLS
ncbi:urokinase plasminogen activator surface receptor-like [Mugil cephalus]|uniref:urokinase plasminogen activator surface receptor-like n=1 Tax=Mugil cephalus TaxID=48193 RepID=UPI001FB5B4FD|nr:urokinase plasminogen activator surface receptor-like [Mugil cephalus]